MGEGGAVDETQLMEAMKGMNLVQIDSDIHGKDADDGDNMWDHNS